MDPLILKFNGGVVTARDPVLISDGQCAQGLNLIFDNFNNPQKCGSLTPYNASPLGGPIRGQISFLAEDGTEYTIVASNGGLYWTAGNGSFTAVKFFNQNEAVSINTSSQYYSFLLYDAVLSGTQKKIIYCTTNKYPLTSNSTHATNMPNAAYYRAVRLQVYNSTIIAIGVYSSTDGSATPGTDEVSVGTNAYTYFPKSAQWMVKIFDRMVAINTADATNGYMISIAQAGADLPGNNVGTGQQAWTGVSPDPAYMSGGGKYPEAFNGGVAFNSSLLLFSRHTVLRVDCAPGPIGNWRETFIPTTLGCIAPQAIVVHSDGWVYYVSEQGICRTNGVIAERVDWDIQDDTLSLAQLKNSSYSLTLGGTDWASGTPTSGDNILSTGSGLLLQLPINTTAQWNACTLTQIDTASYANSVAISMTPISQGILPTISGSNYAVDGGVSALSTLTAGLDQYVNTIWSQNSGTMGFGIVIDLGVLISLTQITVKTEGVTNINSAVFSIFTSPDNSTWTQQGTTFGQNVTQNQAVTVSARYVKLTFTGTALYGGGNSLLIINYIKIYQKTIVMSTVYDFGITPTANAYGNFTALVNIPNSSGDTILFEMATNSTNYFGSPSWQTIGTCSASGNYTISLSGITPQRYAIIRATLISGDNYATTPILSSMVIGAQWLSAVKNLNLVPTTWGTFSSNDTLNNGTIVYEMNTSVDGITWDGWVTLVNGQTPTNTLRQYVQFRLTFNASSILSGLPQTSGLTLNYATSTTASVQPALYSFQDRLYCSFMANGQTYNNYIWVGFTKPTTGLAYEVSQYSEIPYPIWGKMDFSGAMAFSTFHSQLFIGDGLGYLNYMSTGIQNAVCTQASSFVTKAVGSPDAESVFDYLYLYASGNKPMNLYWRTKMSEGSQASKAWSAWSTPIVLQLDQNIGRAVQVLSDGSLANTARIDLSGLQNADFIQFKLEQTNQDSAWSVAELHLYLTPQPPD